MPDTLNKHFSVPKEQFADNKTPAVQRTAFL